MPLEPDRSRLGKLKLHHTGQCVTEKQMICTAAEGSDTDTPFNCDMDGVTQRLTNTHKLLEIKKEIVPLWWFLNTATDRRHIKYSKNVKGLLYNHKYVSF